MPAYSYSLVWLPAQVISVFFLSKLAINELYYFLYSLTKNRLFAFSVITVIFLPGTIVHEMAHLLTALILFLPVVEVKIFPEFKANGIKLGHVLYEKKDVVRGIIVGVAPIFAGLLLFWFMAIFNLFPGRNPYLNILIAYLIFSVSSTMFSSKQDLIDLIYIIPLILISAVIIYLFNIQITLGNGITGGLAGFANKINYFLNISLIINLFMIVIFKSWAKFNHR